MNVVQIIAIVAGALTGAVGLLVVVTVVRYKILLAKPISAAAGEAARLVAGDRPLRPGDTAGLAMDVYLPDSAQGRPPLILFVPGDGPGFLIRGARRWPLFRGYADHAASRGYAAAVMDHRSSRNYKDCPGMVEDVVAALRTLRAQADELGFDADRVVVWTFSGSAGPVASSLLAHPQPGVVGLLSHYGFYDLADYSLKVPEAAVAEFSLPQTLERLDAVPLPVHLVHAGRDRKMMIAGFERVQRVARRKGLPITTRVFAEGRHGFEALEPAEQVEAELERSFAFVGEVLARAADVDSAAC